jgi:antitoxin (DNA-binding transcriptional repressor) of toxin-antitoxin stability system
VSVRELKTYLCEWLARVHAEEVVEVTSHRKPIARITAVNQPDPSSSPHPLQKAIDAGIVSWSGQKPVLLPPVKLNDGGKLVSEILLDGRD